MKRKIDSSVCVSLIALALILCGIIYYRPALLMFLPLLISVGVMFLHSRVSRFAFFLGALNSIIYAVSYWKMTLYSSSFYTLLFSFPIQMITFINWSKHTTAGNTEIKKLSTKMRIYLGTGMVAFWIIFYIVFKALGSEYILIDNAITIFSIVFIVLSLLRFREYTFFNIISLFLQIVTYLMMVKESPVQIIWAIQAAQGVICTFIAQYNIRKQEQKAD